MRRSINISKIFLSLILIVLLQAGSWAGSSADISQIGIGARPMGMGKAYVALADDPSAMFMNPAGIAQIEKPQLLSMQASLLGDINYLTFGGIAPFGPGSIGLGLVQANVDGITLTELDSNNRPRAVEDVTYYDGIWNLTYALPITHLARSAFKMKLPGKLFGGMSLKYFHKGITGYSTGSGTNLDLGLLYIPNSKWRFGITQKNAVPSLGVIGSINWDTGAQDYLLSYTTLGVGYYVDPNWLVLVDYDIAFSGGRKALIHLGTEYTLQKSMVLRTGYEQLHDTTGGNTLGNFTMGLTLYMEDWKIDYAYHPYYNEVDNTTHFLSFGYRFNEVSIAIFQRQKDNDEALANVDEAKESE
ncbi:PorV/PorQ family protein [Candidatus Margulisiibacteriota bacterium]